MATRYDPEVLQTFADRLYQRARWLVVQYVVLGLAAGFVIDLVLSARMEPKMDASNPGIFMLPLLCAIPGFLYGSSKAWQLKLEAQRTLCQLQIERNTRPSATPMATLQRTAS